MESEVIRRRAGGGYHGTPMLITEGSCPKGLFMKINTLQGRMDEINYKKSMLPALLFYIILSYIRRRHKTKEKHHGPSLHGILGRDGRDPARAPLNVLALHLDNLLAANRRLVLLEAHGAEEADRLSPFLLPPRLVPAQLPRHEVDDAGQRRQRAVNIEEGEAGAAGDYVDGRAGGLGADAVEDLRFDEGVVGEEAGSGIGAGGEDCPGAVAVVGREVVRDVRLDVVGLDNLGLEGGGEAVGAGEADEAGLAGAGGGEAGEAGAGDVGEGGVAGLKIKGLDGLVDSLLGHLAEGGPLSAGAGEEVGGGDGD